MYVRTYVRTYVRSVNHVITKRKEVDHIPWVWGSFPRALRARGSPATTTTTTTNNNNNNLHLYSANLFMNVFGCALQYCYIKFMLKVTKLKRRKLLKTTIKAIKNY